MRLRTSYIHLLIRVGAYFTLVLLQTALTYSYTMINVCLTEFKSLLCVVRPRTSCIHLLIHVGAYFTLVLLQTALTYSYTMINVC